MSRNIDEIVRDIDGFRPANGNWLPLDDLLAELWVAGVTAQVLPALFAVFERFPDDDGAGVLWGLVHGVEGLGIDYEQALLDSLARRPSLMANAMLGRLDRSNAR